MALINMVPFDLNRRPGRPVKTDNTRGVPTTTATDAVHKTPEQRPIVNQGFATERRRVERRLGYKPMKKDRRLDLRRNQDHPQINKKLKQSLPKKTSIDVKV